MSEQADVISSMEKKNCIFQLNDMYEAEFINNSVTSCVQNKCVKVESNY